MNSRTTCSKCGSDKVVPRARVIDRGDHHSESGNVRVGVARKPQALMFKGLERTDIWARVCGECGYTELFVEDARSIYQAYLESQEGRE